MTTRRFAAAISAALAGPALAASISSSPTAPAIGADDIANYGSQSGTDKWFYENSAAGAAKGQTFTTGNAAVLLKAITYRTSSGAMPTKTYAIRVGTVAGSTLTFTPITSETATQTAAWAAGDYVTWTLATPVLLQSNTAYGIDVGMTGSTSAWQTGIPYLVYTGNGYAGGALYNSGTSGAGTTAMSLGTTDRLFHLDLEKPISPEFTLVATSPADGAANVLASNPLSATFSRFLTPGTGNLTFRNLTDSIDTVIPIGDHRITIAENLLTINPGSALDWNKSYAVRIDPGALVSDTAASFGGIADDTTWNFTTAAGDPLLDAFAALKNHIIGTATLSAAQIEAQKLTIDAAKSRLATSGAAIAAAFDLVTTYDTVLGALFVARSLPARSSVTNDLHWTIYTVMQHLMDLTYNGATIAAHEDLLDGFRFGSAASFPGPCAPPADPNLIHTATVSASYPNTVGRATQGDGPGTFARKPTGCYLAPGTIATVTVPTALAGTGYLIRVGAHSWDFSNKPDLKRLDRSSLVYAIDATETKIASPLGGGIYLEVPFLADAGVVTVRIRNAVRSPFFSAKSFHATTPAEWLVERAHPAPWADFQSDKFMMQVPTGWISTMPDPTRLMADWDAAMDAINDLMGFPRIRGKEAIYTQVDTQIRASVYAPGYPSVNVGGFSATANYGGYASHYLVRGPQAGGGADIEFHEQGHGYFFPKFDGESESNVNLLYVPVLRQKFGKTLDEAFRASLGYTNTYQTIDTTAVAWMCTFNFSPKEQPMADAEKAYQLKGHAKFVELARLFGWSGLNAFWASFVQDEENGVTSATDTDGMLLRLSRSVGRDIRPLFHFWGIHPQNPTALGNAMTAAGLTAPAEIYDTLVRYQSLVPADNAAFRAFALAWWGRKPLITGYWEETDHAMQWDETEDFDPGGSTVRPNGDIYVEASAASIRDRVQELIDLYYPTGRPADTTPPAIATLSPADDATGASAGTALTATFTKPIVPGPGNLTLLNLTDGTQTAVALGDAGQVTAAGTVLTIHPATALLAGKTYAVRIDAGAVLDPAGNRFAGFADDTTWNFTIPAPDTTAPAITNLSPADGASASVSANLVATFGESITLGTGAITLKNLTNSTQTVITLPNSQVSVAGTVLTINPSANLTSGKVYAVQIAATAVKDAAGNGFAGIADDTTWNFTTVTPDTTAPTMASRSPADNAAGVPANANLVATFSEPVVIGTGYLTLKNLTDATQSVIALADASQVSVAGPVLTLNPAANLGAGKAYAIRIDVTAIDDTAGNSFAGIANDTTWNFTVAADDVPPVLTSSAIADDRGGGPIPVNTRVNYTVTFSEDMEAGTVSAADFGNAGGAAVTIGAVTETAPGVFSVPVTATAAGTLQLKIHAAAVLTDVAGNALVATPEIADDTTIAVIADYTTWAGGAAFDADTNGDGLANGLAWLFGAAHPAAAAGGLRPKPIHEAGELVLAFRCLKSAYRGTVALHVQASTDLGLTDPWTAHEVPVPDADGTAGDVRFDLTDDADPAFVNVRATIPAGAPPAAGRLFGRLKATKN